MADSRTSPEWIDLTQVDDPRDVVHRAVACLATGGVAALPTDTGRALAASALHPEAVARCVAFATDEPHRRPTILLRGPEEASDWAPGLGEVGRRFARRAWPGSFVLVAPAGDERSLVSRLPSSVREAVAFDGSVALRVPSERLLDGILWLTPGPIVTVDLPTSADLPSNWVADSPELEGVEIVVDAGPGTSPRDATAVRVAGDGYEVLRRGPLSEGDVAAMAGTLWLFVCTGNTCRSPMAEAICKALLARRLKCPADALVDRGYVVRSAGVGASEGMPAASHAVEVISSRGGSLKAHQSRRATPGLLRGADLIVALSGEHLDYLLDLAPDVADRARLLHAEGLDIADPIGSDRSVYVETARAIEKHVNRLLDEQGL